MKILITGVSGTGKSTIAKALRERGVYTVDFSDVRNLCFWRDIQTKEKTRYSSVATHEWFDSHEYICDLPRLQEILNEREDIAMTGVASGNQTQILGIFDKVILLQCKSETFRHRMQTREPEWGKTEVAQDNVTKWQQTFEPMLLAYGAIPVSTEGDLDLVIDTILNILKPT